MRPGPQILLKRIRWNRGPSWISSPEHADLAESQVMNEIIWYSVRGAGSRMQEIARLPAFDALREGIAEEQQQQKEFSKRLQTTLARKYR